MVIIVEAARVEDELLAAVRPMLAVSDFGGRLIALSTPFGKRGWFFEAWHNGGEDWTRVEVRAEDCPRISKEFLAEELKQLGTQPLTENPSGRRPRARKGNIPLKSDSQLEHVLRLPPELAMIAGLQFIY